MKRTALLVSLFLVVVLTLALVIPVMAKNGNSTEPPAPLAKVDPEVVELCMEPGEEATISKTVGALLPIDPTVARMLRIVPKAEDCGGLDVLVEPVEQLLMQGESAEFHEVIRLREGDPCQTVKCAVRWEVYMVVSPDEEELVEVIHQPIIVKVPGLCCPESVNPADKNVPPAGSTTLPGPKGGQNEDGFYLLRYQCTERLQPPEPAAKLVIVVGYYDEAGDFVGVDGFPNDTVVKITEAKGGTPFSKPMGSPNSAVAAHIKLPADPVIAAIWCIPGDPPQVWGIDTTECFVPPLPK